MRWTQYTIGPVTDPSDPPPRKKQRAKRPEPDYVIDPNKPNATIELETADLVSLATGGVVDGRAAKTREVQRLPKEQNVFVDLGGEPEPIGAPEQAMPAAPRASTPVNIVAPRASVPTQPLPQEHRIADSMPKPEPPKAATPVNVQRVMPTVPKVEVTRSTSELRAPRRGMGLVVIVYVLSAAALATSIYLRWFA
jgi:hypothetical protein